MSQSVLLHEAAQTPWGLLIAAWKSARVIWVPQLFPPPLPQPPWVWTPMARPLCSWITGEPELPPVVSVT